jgi:SpoVK/Ycf46/Vps4 family AAA+-type ATPase
MREEGGGRKKEGRRKEGGGRKKKEGGTRKEKSNSRSSEMDGIIESKAPVILVGATTHLSQVDPALLRPGRIDIHLSLDLPNSDARRKILRKILEGKPVDLSASFLEEVVGRTRGVSPARLEQIYQEAVMCALREDIHADKVALSPSSPLPPLLSLLSSLSSPSLFPSFFPPSS